MVRSTKVKDSSDNYPTCTDARFIKFAPAMPSSVHPMNENE
jgi:hypothetical protein